MKRPPAAVMFFGHPAITLAVALAFLWVAYLWLQAEASGVAALAALIAAGSCGKANDRYREYRQWKREWDLMGGKPTAAPTGGPKLKLLLGLLAWCLLAAAALDAMAEPQTRWLAMLFWGATALGLLNRLLLWRKSRPPARAREAAVSVCLRKPGRSPSFAEARSALPDYCQRLLAGR
jgi:hypothetical protein